jgi:5'-nucleotidase (lipoprotein e(P4) family)
MSPRPALRPAILVFALFLSACATTPSRAPQPLAATPGHDHLNATLWMQDSAEYRALLRGSYAQARRQLDLALASPDWDAVVPAERGLHSGFEALPPAIIVDADETLLDNSPFQARGVRDDQPYTPERWLAWSLERRALALPGALEFTRYAADRGVTVFFVTNRLHASERDSTADNLLALGFPVLADRSNLFLKGDPRAPVSAKSARRGYIAANHRVLLMLGDQLGDFVDADESSRDARRRTADAFDGWWGERWFMLPNPA